MMKTRKYLLILLLFFVSACRDKETWFPFAPGEKEGLSALDQSHWIEAPAGEHGPLQMNGDTFRFADGTPISFWGVNICSEKPYIDPREANRWVSHLKKYGVNAVRFHKFTRDALTGNKSTQPDSLMMKNFDHFHARLKEEGIYYGWSPVYGHIPLPGDSSRLLFYDEIKNSGLTDHLKGSLIGLVNWAEDLQDLQLELIRNLLERKNIITGKKYADDDALIFVEIQNEDNLYFATTQRVLETCPGYRAILSKRFSLWLKAKYGTQENLLEAWGNSNFEFAREFSKDTAPWHLDRMNICPLANHGVFDYEYRKSIENGTLMPVYLLDMLAFLYQQQNEFYSKAVNVIRSTGYKGAIVASCWQAGSGVSHFYNLHNDYLAGIIDRHNYFGGGTGHSLKPGKVNPESMLTDPGSGLLGTGMQAALGRPFMLSEWMSLQPNEWTAEAVPLIAAYGMGLQGWDGSFAFASNMSRFSTRVESENHGVYNVESPLHLALYPAVVNMLNRGDILEGKLLGTRKVNIESLEKGLIGFTELTDQNGDQKFFDSTIPPWSLAVGKYPVEFTPEFLPTNPTELNEWRDTLNHLIYSSTGQLLWHYGERPWFTVNTPGTAGFTGFCPDSSLTLGNLKIRIQNEFAVVLISCMDPDKTLDNAGELIITAIARAKNTGMEFNTDHTELLNTGTSPALMEPVNFTVSFSGREIKEVRVLDHGGYPTQKTIKTDGQAVRFNGEETKSLYYMLEF